MASESNGSGSNRTTDIYAEHRQIKQKPNRFVNALGKIALAGAAIGVVGAGTRAKQEGNTIEQVKDAVNISRSIVDKINPQEQSAASPTSSVGTEAILSEKTDLNKLSDESDAFINDLLKHPAAVIMGMKEQNKEGVRVNVHYPDSKEDELFTFVWENGQRDKKLLISIKTDDRLNTYVVTKDTGVVTKTTKDLNSCNDESETFEEGKNIVLTLTEKIKTGHELWLKSRGAKGENVASSTESIPSPEITPSPEPTPTSTPVPYNPRPDPFNRGIQEASLTTKSEDQIT